MGSNAVSTPEMEYPPSIIRYGVGKYFVFPVNYGSTGERVVDKTLAMCRTCYTKVGHMSGILRNLETHFEQMLNLIQPHYVVLHPSRAHFSENVIPNLYNKTKAQVERAHCPQTSRSTQSYLTVTAHHLTAEWEKRSHVLQT